MCEHAGPRHALEGLARQGGSFQAQLSRALLGGGGGEGFPGVPREQVGQQGCILGLGGLQGDQLQGGYVAELQVGSPQPLAGQADPQGVGLQAGTSTSQRLGDAV